MGAGSDPATTWQFYRQTWSSYGPYNDCTRGEEWPVLTQGHSLLNDAVGVQYDSTTTFNGTHTSHGRLSAKPLPYGSYSQLDYKAADYTVSN